MFRHGNLLPGCQLQYSVLVEKVELEFVVWERAPLGAELLATHGPQVTWFWVVMGFGWLPKFLKRASDRQTSSYLYIAHSGRRDGLFLGFRCSPPGSIVDNVQSPPMASIGRHAPISSRPPKPPFIAMDPLDFAPLFDLQLFLSF